ncbi:hypothetical protein NC651_025708 [Populus alba x Populus x berolinensis]|nr:hypothetical protein NC651_025708 [Populus alba x Populus x berolinensis]
MLKLSNLLEMELYSVMQISLCKGYRLEATGLLPAYIAQFYANQKKKKVA